MCPSAAPPPQIVLQDKCVKVSVPGVTSVGCRRKDHEITSRHYVRKQIDVPTQISSTEFPRLMEGHSPSHDALTVTQSWGHTPHASETLKLALCSGLRETWRLTRMRALRGTRAGSPLGATWGYACQKTVKCVDYTTEPIMVDLGGYVIILVETKDKKIKLYGKSALRSVAVTASAKGPLF